VEYFSTQNYVGLFLEENAAQFLRNLSEQFAEEAKTLILKCIYKQICSTKQTVFYYCNFLTYLSFCGRAALGTKVEPHSNKQLHITLAYKFPTNQFTKLEELAKKLDLNKPSAWEVRLYSKDPKFGDCETLRVLYPYSPTSETHLQLINGDCIFVGPEDVSDASKSSFEGWFYGTSWMTGCSGFFPATHTEKSTDTDTWTIHKNCVLTSKATASDEGRKLQRKYSRGADEFHTSGYSSQTLLQNVKTYIIYMPPKQPLTYYKHHHHIKDIAEVPEIDEPTHQQIESRDRSRHVPVPSNSGVVTTDPPPRPPKDDVYAQVQKPKGISPVLPTMNQRSRRIYIFRHAERVDVTFGKQWIKMSFDEQGHYHRKNLNMPQKIPKRVGGPEDFNHDSPITEMGLYQAFLTGQGLRGVGVNFSHVFSSPSLRCLQTANAILKGMGDDKKLNVNVDLALYEWMKWSPGGLPKFMDASSMNNFGIKVDKNYRSWVSEDDMPHNERCSDYFKRCHKFISRVAKETKGDILITGHAGSLDGLSRQIQGLSPRPMPEFVGIVTKIPYCGSLVLEDCPELGIWQIVDPPYPPLTHAPNPRFDWKILQG
uniref:Protein UBASH3A homolog n=1 Tax=Ciona intestinalis TaxID=7719 RepID=F6PWD4_CIOIN